MYGMALHIVYAWYAGPLACISGISGISV